MTPQDISVLRCPKTHAPLTFKGQWRGEHAWRGKLETADGTQWQVRDGLPQLFEQEDVRPPDRFMQRWFYNTVPKLHDPAVRILLPLMQSFDQTEDQLRDGYFDQMKLNELPEDRPVRVLEVSVGTGANLPRLRARLANRPVEIWGLDLSAGMMGTCRKNGRAGDTRLLLADAHALPFADNSFDRVFHIGGINGFGDPALALRELGRVARPNTPIVVVDEQLDANSTSLWHRVGFRAITLYDDDPRAPVDQLPPNAVIDDNAQLSRFFYGLAWHLPE